MKAVKFVTNKEETIIMKNTIGKGVFAKGGAVLSKENALISAMQMGVDFDKDFHAQSYGNELAELAKKVRYRKSKTSSGSLGRAFFDHLKKIYDKNPSKYQNLVKSYSLGGDVENFSLFEIVVVSKELNKDGGYKFNNFPFRVLVSAENMHEAKEIAKEYWDEAYSDSDLFIVEILSDAEYRSKYLKKMAKGGGVKGGNYYTIYQDEEGSVKTEFDNYEDALADFKEFERDDANISLWQVVDGKNIFLKQHNSSADIEYVELSNGDIVVTLEKQDGKWYEGDVLEGEEPYAWGSKTYMGYLKPKDLAQWLGKDYGGYFEIVDQYGKGGGIGFKGLSAKVAKRYAGKKVAPKYQGEYGKRYSKSEAKEVGDKVAGKVYWQQQGRKMAMGGGLAQYPNDLPKAEAERLFHLSHKNAKVGDRLWNNFKRTPLRLIYSNLDERGIKYARGGNVNEGGKILQEISTHKAVKKGDKIYIYLKGLTIKNDDDREFAKEFPDLFKDELLRVIPAENEDDLFDIFENYEETNRYNLSGYARGGNVNTGRAWRLDRAKYNKSERYEIPYSERKSKFEDGGQIGQEIVFDDSGEENTGVIKDITNAGDYIVKSDDGRTLLAQRELDVISLGAMRSASTEAPKKRFGFFEDGGELEHSLHYLRLEHLSRRINSLQQQIEADYRNESVDSLTDKMEAELERLTLERELMMFGKDEYEDGGQIGQEIVFDDSGEENTGVIKDVTNAGDYIVSSDDGRTLLAQRDRDVISLGKMREKSMAKKRFGFFEEGGGVDNMGVFGEKKVITLKPTTTLRDKKGFRFYSTNGGNTLYAEKNDKVFNVSENDFRIMSQVPERFTFIGLIDDNDVKDLDPFYYEKKSMQEIRNSFGMAEGGGVDEKVILSFSFNEDNVNLKDVIDVVKTYSADYYTSGDMSERSLYVTLRKSKASELKSDIKSEFDVYDFEIVKSRYQYAEGGGVSGLDDLIRG